MLVRSAGARLALFLIAVAALAAAFGTVARFEGLRSPLGTAAILAIEIAAIALAVLFHLVELPSVPARADGRGEPVRIDVDYF